MKAKIIVIIIILLISSDVLAGLSLKDYEESNKNDGIMTSYVVGIGDGVLFANVELITKKQDPLFCQPGKLGLAYDNYRDIIDRQIEYMKTKNYSLYEQNKEKFPLALILLQGLIATFPCK